MLLIVNPLSGTNDGGDLVARAEQAFAAAGRRLEVIRLRHGDDIAALARNGIDRETDGVIAAGGDGTVSAVASVLAGTATPLGVIPAGTLNHFVKALGVDADLDAALAVILRGGIRAVDVGEVNGRVFVNNSSIGLYPSIVSARTRQQQRLGRGKWPAFAWALLSALRRYPFLFVRLCAGPKQIVCRVPFVFIGNNEYNMEGLRIGTRERLDGGVLGVYMSRGTGRWGLVRLALRALFSRLRDARDLDVVRLAEFSIETPHRRLQVACDGEVHWLESPLMYRVRPRALRVFAPSAPDAGA